MNRRLLILGALACLTVSAAAASAQAPTWNSGYDGWWPGGFGYRPLTVQAHDYPCSVTAYGPTFKSGRQGWTQHYGGGTSCARGVGRKTLTISEQVLAPNGRTWITIAGSKVTTGPSSGNPVRMIAGRPAFLGHLYRTVVFAALVVPNGHAGCSLTNTCLQNISITAASRRLAP